MRKVALVFGYHGKFFLGYQIQPKGNTVQAVLESALTKICNEKIRIIAAGRTDTGVHAAGQVVHFETKSTIEPKNLRRALNSILPESIQIFQAKEVKRDFHARFNAKKREYIYILSFEAPALLHMKDFVWDLFPKKLNVPLMQRAVKLLKGKHDFSYLCAVQDESKNKIRTIYTAQLRKFKAAVWVGSREAAPQTIWALRIVANGFLLRMVRMIVGFLVDIGEGNSTVSEFKDVLKGKNIGKKKRTAPAQGLSLTKVWYKDF